MSNPFDTASSSTNPFDVAPVAPPAQAGVDFSKIQMVQPKVPLPKDPFANTLAGQIFNTIAGVASPENQLKGLADVFHGFTDFGASTFAVAPVHMASDIFTGSHPDEAIDFGKIADSIHPVLGTVMRGLFGTEPVPDVASRLQKTYENPAVQRIAAMLPGNPGVNDPTTNTKLNSIKLAILGVVGGDALNFLGGGDGAIEKRIVDSVSDEASAALLKGLGLSEEVATKMAPTVTAAKTPEDAQAVLAAVKLAHGAQALSESAPTKAVSDQIQEQYPHIPPKDADAIAARAIADTHANPDIKPEDGPLPTLEEAISKEVKAYVPEEVAVKPSPARIENVTPTEALTKEAESHGYTVNLIDKKPKGFYGKHFPDAKTIEIYTRNRDGSARSADDIEHTLAHELGHILDYKRRGIVADPMGDSVLGYDGKLRPASDGDIYFRDSKKQEADAIRASAPRGDHAANTQKEIYADAYVLYKKEPEKLQQIAPRIFKELSDFDTQNSMGEMGGTGSAELMGEIPTVSQDGVPSTSEEASGRYWDEVITKQKAQGKTIEVSGDAMKKFFHGDYDPEKSDMYAKASFDTIKRLSADPEVKTIAWLGGGPGAGKTEFLGNAIKDGHLADVLYDTTLTNADGARELLNIAKANGKEVTVDAILSNLTEARKHTILREAATGRGVPDEVFADRHAKFPATLRELLQDGTLKPEQVRLYDLRNVTDPEEAKQIVRMNITQKDPLAILQKVRYDKEILLKQYARQNIKTEIGPSDASARKRGKAGGSPGGRGSDKGAGSRSMAGQNAGGKIGLGEGVDVQPKLLDKSLPDFFETKSRPKTIPKIAEAPAGATPSEAIAHYTSALRDVYKAFGKAAEESLFYTKARYLELSEPGSRYVPENGGEAYGISSSFPDWVPDELRSMALFKKVLADLKDVGTMQYPSRPNATKQRALMDQVFSDTDSDLGVDTSGVRSRIMSEYDRLARGEGAQTKNPREVRGGAAGSQGRRVESSVGDGTQMTPEARAAQEEAAAAAGPKKIQDRIPLPRSIGEIMLENGRRVAADKSPADVLAELAKGPHGGSWQSLVKGYMYNFSPAKKAHILDYAATPEFVLEKVGLGKGAEMLQDAKDRYLTTIKKEFKTIEAWKERVKTPGAERVIFQWLDGREKELTREMTPEEHVVAKEIRAYLKDWAERLKLPGDSQISRYITHIFERDFNGPPEENFMDPELASIMSENVAKSVYDPFLQKRLGKPGYVEDVWRALDAYVKRASRKEAMDPALETLSEMAKQLDDRTYNYVKALSHRVNMRPTELEKSMDSLITQTPIGQYFTNRPVAFLSRKLRQIFYRGTLGLNMSSAIRNLSQGTNTYAKLGEKYTTIGYAKIFSRMLTKNIDELYDQNILSDELVQDRNIGLIRKGAQKVDKALFSLFETAEKINRGAAYYGAKSKALARGLSDSEATKYAKRIVRETQFAFSSVDTPVALNDDVVKTLAQLQSYNLKQMEFLGRMIRQKDFAGMIRWTASTLAFLYTIGRTFGMTANQVIPTVGLGGAPFTSTMLAIPGLFSKDAQTKAKAQSQLQRNLMSLVPGGAQIRKTVQGAEALAQGGSFTPTGKFRFRVDSKDALQALIFGPSVLPQAQNYYQNVGKKKATTSAGNPFD